MEHELLNGLSPVEVDQVLALGTRIRVPSGSSLFQLGDPADRIFLTVRGRIHLTVPILLRGRKEEILIEERSPGQMLGWPAVVPPHRSTVSARAPLETEVIALSREALLAYFESSPAIAYKVSLNVAIVIGHRLQLVQAMWLREMQRTIELRSGSGGAVR
jgi:CRP-like cAMP-binding protein